MLSAGKPSNPLSPVRTLAILIVVLGTFTCGLIIHLNKHCRTPTSQQTAVAAEPAKPHVFKSVKDALDHEGGLVSLSKNVPGKSAEPAIFVHQVGFPPDAALGRSIRDLRGYWNTDRIDIWYMGGVVADDLPKYEVISLSPHQ